MKENIVNTPESPQDKAFVSLSVVRLAINRSPLLDVQKKELFGQIQQLESNETAQIQANHVREMEGLEEVHNLKMQYLREDNACETKKLRESHENFKAELLNIMAPHLDTKFDIAADESISSKIEIVEEALGIEQSASKNTANNMELSSEERIIKIVQILAEERDENAETYKNLLKTVEGKLQISPLNISSDDERENIILDVIENNKKNNAEEIVPAVLQGLFGKSLSDLTPIEKLYLTNALKDIGIQDFGQTSRDQQLGRR